MPSRKKKAISNALPFNAADMANIAKANPYIQRLIEDPKLRENVQTAIESTKRAYARVSNGKAPAKALLEDKKLQSDLSTALASLRDASLALSNAPKARARKARGFGRKLVVLGLGGGLALVGSEKLRSKVLDTLFGKEEEFQYTPPATTSPSGGASGTSESTTSVGAA